MCAILTSRQKSKEKNLPQFLQGLSVNHHQFLWVKPHKKCSGELTTLKSASSNVTGTSLLCVEACNSQTTLFTSFHGLEPEAYLQVNVSVAIYWNTLEPVAQIDAEKQNRAQIEFYDLHLFLLFNMVKTLKVNTDFCMAQLVKKTHVRSCQHN